MADGLDIGGTAVAPYVPHADNGGLRAIQDAHPCAGRRARAAWSQPRCAAGAGSSRDGAARARTLAGKAPASVEGCARW